jgi:histidine triad (HIT) family protein
MAYDHNNVFAKILSGTIPCKKIHESEHALAFADIAPNAPVHVLVIPKGPYQHYSDFITNASEMEILDFFRTVHIVAHAQGVGEGFRLITNNGESVGQTVHHFHVHVLGGKVMSQLGVE